MKKQIQSLLSVIMLAFIFVVSSCSSPKTSQKMSDDEIVDIATKAYVFGYPLVIMDFTKKVGTNVPMVVKSAAPVNQIGHAKQFPDDKFTDIVKPNVDTYYSMAWLNLKEEPMVLSVPATERYYLLPILDAYTNIFASPGTRTTGSGAHTFLITGPKWDGEVPEGMELIQSPTAMAWILGRIQVNSPEDGATVVKNIQKDITLTPMSEFGNSNYVASKGTVVDAYNSIIPVKNTAELSTKDFFTKMAHLMVENPPFEADSTIVKAMASIGIVPGTEFGVTGFSPELQTRLDSIPQKVMASMKGKMVGSDNKINGWSTSTMTNPALADFGTDYGFRALIAYFGLGANLQKDAVYPNAVNDSEGNVFSSDNKYMIHFNKEEIPPVDAFWSLTMYNNKNFLAANPINRYAIGDRNDIKFNEDGSLDIYIQRERPEKDKESNWLPTPQDGTFQLTMRLYWPQNEVLSGEWNPAPVLKIE